MPDANSIHRESEIKIFRDSLGRVRGERQMLPTRPNAGTVVAITDRANGLLYDFLPEKKVGFKAILPPGTEFHSDPSLGRWGQATRQPSISVEDLGHQMMGGVLAEGKRITKVIAEGVAGNTYPLEIVTERWYSPEFQITLSVRVVDPTSGETSYELRDIQHEEPSASLFELPADIKVQESTGFRLQHPNDEPRTSQSAIGLDAMPTRGLSVFA